MRATVLGCWLLFASVAAAQEGPWRWTQGDTLRYRTSHVTDVAETVNGSKVASSAKVTTVKEWHVAEVDAAGVATLQMSLSAMRNEQQRPGGDTLLYDSADASQGSPEFREQLSKYVGKTLAVLRVDRRGKVVEAVQGSADRYDAEPPFALVFPATLPKAGDGWDRPYDLVLAPPLGTGEKYRAVQHCTCQQRDGDIATFAVTTEFKTQPDTAQERLPFLQKEQVGSVAFDAKRGRVVSVRFALDRTVENHQGVGSRYHFRSDYREELLK